MTDHAEAGRAPARRARDRLPQLARHPQPRGWRRRARPRGGGRGAGRARRPGHGLQRGLRGRTAGGRDPRRPLRAPRLEAVASTPRGMQALRRGDLGHPDLVVDVQNGLPFFTRLVTRRPVIVLVHHVHREQWPVVYPGTMGKVGWWIESRLAPAALPPVPVRHRLARHPGRARRSSGWTRAGSRSCTTAPTGSGRSRSARPTYPSICVVGRLVPHKQVEHAIDAVAELRDGASRASPLTVVGSGWWEARPPRVRRGAPARRTSVRVPGTGGRGDQGARSTRSPGCWPSRRSRRAGAWWSARRRCAGTPTVAYAERRRHPRVDRRRRVRAPGRRPGGLRRTRCARLLDRRRAAHAAGARARAPTAVSFTWEQTQVGLRRRRGAGAAGRRSSARLTRTGRAECRARDGYWRRAVGDAGVDVAGVGRTASSRALRVTSPRS